jgi:acyl dehydratase
MIDLGIVGKKLGPSVFNYTWRDVVLYALSIGAQTHEAAFIYEGASGGLKVFPSYGVIMGAGVLIDSMKTMRVDPARFIHGEQGIRLFRPLPSEGRTYTEGKFTNIYDKGKGAVFLFRSKTFTADGDPLCEGECSFFYLGEGGFGGDPGPKADPFPVPEGDPVFTVSYRVPANQAALYRLNGDLNPLHVDPQFAKRGGFDRPILHGLCTYGYAARAILHSACGGEVSLFKEFKARFSGVVYPGDTLVTQGWKAGPGRYLIVARTERGEVLNRAYALTG